MATPPISRPWTLLLIASLIWMAIWLSAFIYLEHRRSQLENHQLEQLSAMQAMAWEAAQRIRYDSINTYFEEYVLKPQTIDLLRQTQTIEQRDQARIQLYRHLFPVYDLLQERGIRQFQFVLPNGESLLRFHQPEHFGDYLLDLRPGVAMIFAEQRPVSGFAVGRTGSGFRHLFPILDPDSGAVLAGVELGLPFDVVRQEMATLIPAREFEMLLRAEVIPERLFDTYRRLYAQWPGSVAFMVEDPLRVLPGAPPPPSTMATRLAEQLATDQQWQQRLMQRDSFVTVTHLDGRFFTLVLTQLHDIQGQPVGLVASYAPEPALDQTQRNFRWSLFGISLLLLLLAAVGLTLYRENAQKLQERRTLQIINDTLGEGLYVMDERGAITHANQRACEFLGYAPNALLGRIAHDLFHSHPNNEHQALEHCPIFTTVRHLKEYQGIEIFRRSDQSLFAARVTSRPIVIDDILRGSVTSFADISEQVAMQEALRDSEARYRSVVDNIREVIFQMDLHGRLSFLNQTWLEVSGYTVEDSLGQPLLDWLMPEEQASMTAWLNGILQGEMATCRRETRLRHQNGGCRWVEVHIRALSNARGDLKSILGTLNDITERRHAETRLRLAASVFTEAHEGIMITDAQGDILEVNAMFTAITGYSRADVLGRNPRFLKSGRQPREYYTSLWQSLLDKGHWYGEVWNRRKNGEIYAQLLNISAVRDAQGVIQNFVALFTDITTLKEHQKQLERVAHYDLLTGLPNRILLADRLQQAMAHARRSGEHLAVVYLDLDGFKRINDRHGHDLGDDVLVWLSQGIKQVLCDGDTLTRIGGDEFALVLVGLKQAEDCYPMLEQILAAIATPIELKGITLQLSASLGVTFYPQDSGDADQLLRHADQAMYVAKQQGKNRYHRFDLHHDEAVRIQHASLEAFRHALEHNELLLYYQPKVNMQTGVLLGVEALLRWQHPERGLLSPGEFLHLLEDDPLAEALDLWVLEQALRQRQDWERHGHAIPISVNISARQLQQDAFVATLAALLQRYPDVQPQTLELEVLETGAFSDMGHASLVLQGCRELGLHIALDDFGTGYSSLTYLKRLPTDTLKIDQSFIRDMLHDPEDFNIVQGILGLASAFSRQVIAEGVETEEHGDILLALGCTLAQGYGIARPMPATQVLDWARTWQPPAVWQNWQGRGSTDTLHKLFLAQVEHRAWVKEIIDCVQSGSGGQIFTGNEDTPYAARWCRRVESLQCQDIERYTEVLKLQRAICDLARDLLHLYRQGQQAKARAGLDELKAQSRVILQALRHL